MNSWETLTVEEKIDRLAEYLCLFERTKSDKEPEQKSGYTMIRVTPTNEGLAKWRKETFGRQW